MKLTCVLLAMCLHVSQTMAGTKLGSTGGAQIIDLEAPANTNILDGDFLTGFETGIFLRKQKDQVDEYGCPKAAIKMEEFQKVRDLLPGIKGILSLMNPAGAGGQKDNELENMLDSLTVLINHLDELIGVFDYGYEGGDFCAGLIFGASGSNLLFTIAETIVSHVVKTSGPPKPAALKKDEKTSSGKDEI